MGTMKSKTEKENQQLRKKVEEVKMLEEREMQELEQKNKLLQDSIEDKKEIKELRKRVQVLQTTLKEEKDISKKKDEHYQEEFRKIEEHLIPVMEHMKKCRTRK